MGAAMVTAAGPIEMDVEEVDWVFWHDAEVVDDCPADKSAGGKPSGRVGFEGDVVVHVEEE